jgi:hypothetical protein
VRGASRINSNDRCGGRSGDTNRIRFWGWRGLSCFARLLGDITLGRLRAVRRNILCILHVPCHLFLLSLHCSPHLFLFLLLYLNFSPRVDPLHDICIRRVEHPKRELTGLPRVKGTSTTIGGRSGNSMPSSCRLFGVVEKGLLTHSRKRDWVAEPPALSLLPRDGEEKRPGSERRCEDILVEICC